MTAVMILVHGTIILVISVYGSEYSSDDNQKDNFYPSLAQEIGRLNC